MATLKKIKKQVENINALGVANIISQGIDIPHNATTYEIMQSIADIINKGIIYTDIVYNKDNTVTLTDKDGIVHTLKCTYEDDKIVSVTYDGKIIRLGYNGDFLVKLGITNIDISNAPKEPFMITESDAFLEDIHDVSDVILINPMVMDTSNTLAQLVEE